MFGFLCKIFIKYIDDFSLLWFIHLLPSWDIYQEGLKEIKILFGDSMSHIPQIVSQSSGFHSSG